MLSVQRVTNPTYYDDLTRIGAYFSAATEPPGIWFGSGAKALGLGGHVTRHDLERLAAGFSPAGKALVKNAGKKLEEHKDGGHRPGWDLTFSAPKSVSVVWAMANPVMRDRIERCHNDAVVATLEFLEEHCGWSRRGKAGKFFEPARLVVATYQHGSSRALDPQLHTHSFVLNVGVCEDGKTRTLHSQEFYRWKMVGGKYYQNQLGQNLQERIGLPIRVTPHGCEVAGIGSRLTSLFSKRREQIEARLLQTGRHSAKAAEAAALATRPAKATEPREALHRSWQEIAKARFGFGEKDVDRLCREMHVPPLAEAAVKDLVRETIAQLLTSNAHFTKRELLREVLQLMIGKGWNSRQVSAAVDDYLARSLEIVRLQERNLERHYTTQEMHALEEKVLDTARKMVADKRFEVSRRIIDRVLKTRPEIMSRPEQVRAVESLLKPGRLKLLTGMPGTGKTYVLDAVREAFEKAGYHCLGAAVAGKAVRGLADKANIKGVTVEKLIRDFAATPWDAAKHHGKQLVQAAVRKPTYAMERISLGPRSVVLIDEASMLDTVQTHKILQEADRRGAKVILVGDPKQLPAIGAGSPFQGLLARHEHVSLVNIERQRNPEHIAAIHAAARGEMDQFVAHIVRDNRLTVGADRHDALARLTRDWQKFGGTAKPDEHRIFVATNLDCLAANDACQKLRLEAQPRTAMASLTIRCRQEFEDRKPMVVREDFYVGDPVMCLQRSKRLAVENGTLGIVTAIDRLARTLTMRVCGESTPRIVELPLANYPHLTRAYAQTTHKAQGETVENAYVLLGGAMQSRELTYVQASRAKGETRFYADQLECGKDRSGLVRMLDRSAAKLLAHDLALAQPEPPPPAIKPAIVKPNPAYKPKKVTPKPHEIQPKPRPASQILSAPSQQLERPIVKGQTPTRIPRPKKPRGPTDVSPSL